MKNIDIIRNHKGIKSIVLFLSSFCVLLSFVGYIGLLVYLLIQKEYMELIKTILIPLSTITIVEIIRHLYNRPRPFEKYRYLPLIDHRPGRSFPSKHATSSMIIALSIYHVLPSLGMVFLFNALLVGITRILSGIHYPSDVCGGYILGYLMYLFYLI